MITQLHRLCEVNSGTENLKGLSTLLQMLKEAFEPVADDTQVLSFPPTPMVTMQGERKTHQYGQALWIRKRPHLKRRVLLMGHMDTVYSETSPFQQLTYLDEHRLNGPGVADMKGGLIILLEALKAFETLPVASTLGWDVLINADEEIGSTASSAFYEEIANKYSLGLVYEPSLNANGDLAKNRRGNGKLTLIATGKTAHAGRAFDQGRNAICYLAEALLEIKALNDLKKDVTINVGKIAGGDALNMVPDKAVVKMDVRIADPDDEHWVFHQLNEMIDRLKRPDYSLTLEGGFGRPVKRVNESTRRLFQEIQTIEESFGRQINWEDSGGCCDGNNLAKHGLAVIDTLGARGGSIHTPDEYIILDSLVERASLSTVLLSRLAEGLLEELQP